MQHFRIPMLLRWKERLLTWVVPTVLVCVLAVLAGLQYRWSTEVSEAATTRMQSSLQNSMMNFRQDLAGQMGILCMELQAEAGSAPLDARRLVKKLERWRSTNSSPDLVSKVYVWRASEDPDLFRLGLPEARFEATDWPSQLHGLQQVLSAAAPPLPPRSGHGGGRSAASKSSRPDGDAPKIGGIDESVPMLIVPAAPLSRSTWLLLELSKDVLERSVFPELATRYFGNTTTSEYAVALVSNRNGHVQAIYSSDATFLTDADSAVDGSLNLFGPPVSQGLPPRPPLGLFRQPRLPVTEPDKSVSMPLPGNGPIRFDPIQSGESDPDWRIVVKHRKGSVEAAVTALRHRNLAVSFFVLLTLAGSVGLIIFNSYHARWLARLQMDFVAGVSHELRTPVAAILSIADNIASGVVGDEQRFVYYGDLIRTQARQLNHLVEQVLSFSATRNHNGKATHGVFQVSDAIDEALTNTAPVIASSAIDVRCSVDPNTPAVWGDTVKLSQCLQNLITNAVKYSGDGKSISIDVRPVQNGTSTRQVEISVTDRGIGIDADDRKRIFEAFYRSPQVAESRIHGTGLGLSLTKSYVESMGGEIGVVSEPNKGSTFTIRLPAASESSRGEDHESVESDL